MVYLKDLIFSGRGGAKADVAIVGVPYDEGIIIEGGRSGAALAPESIRAELRQHHREYNLKHDVDLSNLKIIDMGDVNLRHMSGGRAYAEILEFMKEAFEKYPVIIVLGGAHSISYPTIRALSETEKRKIGGINIDAHLDVKNRDDLGSGTPFGKLLRDGLLKGKNFVEMGLHDNFAAKEDIDFLRKSGSKIVTFFQADQKGMDKSFEESFRVISKGSSTFLSIDIDSVAEAFAPGCSAPSSDGFSPKDIIKASYLAGKQKNLRLFEIMEVNPKFDIDNRTSRLAATMVAAFLTGLAKVKS